MMFCLMGVKVVLWSVWAMADRVMSREGCGGLEKGAPDGTEKEWEVFIFFSLFID